MRQFNPIELKHYLDNNAQPLLLDVREPWEFEFCHLSGSILLPMSQLPKQLATLDPHQETVVICHHGIRSQHVGLFLEQMGFTQIINLKGGIDAWAHDIDPQMPTY